MQRRLCKLRTYLVKASAYAANKMRATSKVAFIVSKENDQYTLCKLPRAVQRAESWFFVYNYLLFKI
jgi:hypothetical protein